MMTCEMICRVICRVTICVPSCALVCEERKWMMTEICCDWWLFLGSSCQNYAERLSELAVQFVGKRVLIVTSTWVRWWFVAVVVVVVVGCRLK